MPTVAEPDLSLAEIRTAFKAIRKDAGPKADLYLAVQLSGDEAFSATLYPDGICGSRRMGEFRVEGASWRATADLLASKWADWRATHRAERIRDMALEIIRITSEQGECSDFSLRLGTFTDEDIEQLGGFACTKAREMASLGPFSIRKTSSNSPPTTELNAALDDAVVF